MTFSGLKNELKSLLASDRIAVSGGQISDFDTPPFPGDHPNLAKCAPKRRMEFTAGRCAARTALAQFGMPAQAIPAGASRGPQWPQGFTGSITHDRQFCLSAVARTSDYRAIGVDLEPQTQISREMSRLFLSEQEKQALHRLAGYSSDQLMITVFSAKESTYKALNPLNGTLQDPHEFKVYLDVEHHTFDAVSAGDGQSLGVKGRWTMLCGHVMSCAVMAA